MTHHQDAISLLTDDHRTVEQLFADYERGLQGPEAKRQVVDQIIRELSVHAAIEEAYFYPEVRKALGEGGERGTGHSPLTAGHLALPAPRAFRRARWPVRRGETSHRGSRQGL